MQMLCRNVPFLTKTVTNTTRNLYYHGQQHRSLLFRSTCVSANSLITTTRLCSSNNMKEDDSGKYKVATIPNAICALRIAATPVIGYLVVNQHFAPAFIMFVIAGLTDLIDGYIARHFKGQKSLLGSVLDPMADKLLVSVMFLTMTHANLIPLPLTCIVIFRDVCLIVGGFYKRYQTMQPPYSLNRFFNPEVSSMQVVPTTISKINTALQLAVVATSLSSPVFEFGTAFNQGLSVLYWTTAATTIYSGLQYASGRAIKKV